MIRSQLLKIDETTLGVRTLGYMIVLACLMMPTGASALEPIAQTILEKGFEKCREARNAQVRSTNIAKRRYKQYEVYLTEAKRIEPNLLEEITPDEREKVRQCEAVIQEIVRSEAIVHMEQATQNCEAAFEHLVENKINRAKNSHSLYLKNKYKSIELSPTVIEQFTGQIDYCDTFGDKVAEYELAKAQAKKENSIIMERWREMRQTCFKLRIESSAIYSNRELQTIEGKVKKFRRSIKKLESGEITRRIADNADVFGHLEYGELSEVIKRCELDVSYNLGAATAKMTKTIESLMEDSRQALRHCESAKWVLKQAASDEYLLSREADLLDFISKSEAVEREVLDKLFTLNSEQKGTVSAVLNKADVCQKDVLDRIATAQQQVELAKQQSLPVPISVEPVVNEEPPINEIKIPAQTTETVETAGKPAAIDEPPLPIQTVAETVPPKETEKISSMAASGDALEPDVVVEKPNSSNKKRRLRMPGLR